MYEYNEVYQYSQSLNVLYVEDDVNFLKENKIIFENFFSKVITASDGVEALEKYKTFKDETSNYFDLVISDLVMPKLDGISMIKELKILNPNQEVIIISAYDDSNKLKSLIKIGVSNFLMKPLNMNIFLDTIAKVCENISNKKKIDLICDIINLSRDHISFIDRNYIYRQVNKAYLNAHNKKYEDIVGYSISQLMGEDIFQKIIKERFDYCLQGKEIHYKEWFNFKNIGKRYMDVFYYPRKTSSGAISGVVVTSHDITELIQAQEKLEELANTDQLTKLYNRHYFYNIAQEIVNLTIREKTSLSVMMIDIDKFKNINDTYGHANGDIVIQSLAKIMVKNTRKSDIVARIGGEEFVILLPNTSKKDTIILAHKLRKIVEDYLIISKDNKKINFTISIGVDGIDIENETNIDQALFRADKALYKAKENGRNKVYDY